MMHHQQHHQWQHHHQMQQQQQQQWHHQNRYMGGHIGYVHGGYEQYGYSGDYNQMYSQVGRGPHPSSGGSQGMNANNGSVVGPGGPSPVGSHNMPSPQL